MEEEQRSGAQAGLLIRLKLLCDSNVKKRDDILEKRIGTDRLRNNSKRVESRGFKKARVLEVGDTLNNTRQQLSKRDADLRKSKRGLCDRPRRLEKVKTTGTTRTTMMINDDDSKGRKEARK